MNTVFLIFIGSGLGGILRYAISNGIYLLFKRQFPLGTLIVNISGCFLMGLLFILLLERFEQIGSALRAVISWHVRWLHYLFFFFNRNH